MKPTIYFNEEPCEEAKEILLEYFNETENIASVIWTGLDPVVTNYTVATPCTGTDHVKGSNIIYLDEEFKSDIGDTVTSTAEHTLSLILQLSKLAKKQLSEKTIGIIGHGRIGGLVYDYCDSLNMNMLIYDVDSPYCNCSLNYLCKNSDIISIHIPLDGNENLISEKQLSKMKKDIIIVNTSRRNVVNYKDIVYYLNNSSIYYADDFGHNYFNSSRCIITPHIGGNCIEAREITDVWLAKKLIRYWRSKNP